jgi:hypothetical protein
LVSRVSKHDCFIAIVINAQYISNRVTENEWKNDFIIPPHLKAGTLIQYKEKFGKNDDLRNAYGLLLQS